MFLSSILVFLFSFCLSLLLIFSPTAMANASIFHFEGTPPDNLGINQGFLSPCPSSPNCIVSEETDETHYIEPISYNSDRNTAKSILRKVLSVVPNTIIIEDNDNYIRTESRSKIMGFVDDAEFYFPEDDKIIKIRSASRLGESDLGVNRRRLEQIRLAMADLNA